MHTIYICTQIFFRLHEWKWPILRSKILISSPSSSCSMALPDFGGYRFPSSSVLRRPWQSHFIGAFSVAEALNERQFLVSMASLTFTFSVIIMLSTSLFRIKWPKRFTCCTLIVFLALFLPTFLQGPIRLRHAVYMIGEGFFYRITFLQLPVAEMQMKVAASSLQFLSALFF